MTRNVNIQTSVRDVEKNWFNRKEAARYIGVSTDWIKKRNLEGELGYSKWKGVVFISKRELDKILEQHKVI